MTDEIEGRTIDEHQEFHGFIFGYNDTERIAVEYYTNDEMRDWTVTIEEQEHTLARARWGFTERRRAPMRPSRSVAQECLRRYWAGEWPGRMQVAPRPPQRKERRK